MRNFVTPGQLLSITAKLLHEGSGYTMIEAQAKVDGKLVCNADITFRVMKFPNDQFRVSMEQVAERISFPMKVFANG